MALEEEGYALLAWQRFDDDISDELLRAVTSVFALVAAADGDVAKAEGREFLSMLRSKTESFGALDFDTADRMFQNVCGALLSDPAAGRTRALREIKAIQHNETYVELVISAAEIAVNADDRINASETRIVDEIRKTLAQ